MHVPVDSSNPMSTVGVLRAVHPVILADLCVMLMRLNL